jgi:outer membrane protein TolC
MAANRVKPIALVAACLIGAIPVAARAQDTTKAGQDTTTIPTVSLDQAIELALRVQPAVVQARGAVTNAQSSKREAMGAWLPTVTSSGSWGLASNSRYNAATGTFVSADRQDSYSAGLSASLTLFDGFQRAATNRSASATLASADAKLTNQQFQVILQVKQAFFNALAARELVRVSQTQMQRAEEQLKVAQEKLAAGSATRSDTLRSRVEVGNAQLAQLTAQTALATAEANLARLIGYDGPVRALSDSSLFVMPSLDTAALRDEVLRTAPSVVAAEADAKAAAASVAVSRATYFPQLRGSFSNTWSGPVGVGTDSLTHESLYLTFRRQWQARLTVSWDLFNGFTREGSVSRAVVSRESAAAQADDARRLASAQLTQQLAALQSTRSQITIAISSRAAAEEDLRVVRERYRLGAATIVDVLTSQVTLDQAEVSVVQAALNFLVARAQLESLLGRSL